MRFRAMLGLHWRVARDQVAALALLGFALPMIIAKVMFGVGAVTTYSPLSFLEFGEQAASAMAVVVALAGVWIGGLGYHVDGAVGHVHALSLPMERWRFILYRAGGGMILLLVPVLATSAGGMLAVGGLPVPEPLESYHLLLAARLTLAAWLMHALTFGFRHRFGARGARVFLWLLLGTTTLFLLSEAAHLDLAKPLLEALFGPAGPVGLLTARWALIDV